ncbi:heterokaryon incompatibility protein [Colletotrichum kahawae]|uniref:Heterokaryon incompatibility protein n=1 Tax=Colletotrichum kahawae TaxID=34407 RepID=A0AAD9XW20_COLKA|nr:heterokaryon incompatibility protein [Colletotrichum kahawae]
MRKEPLTKRAWGFQERILARRILHFASEQMYWECLEGFEAEQGLKLEYRLPFINDDTELVEYVDQRYKMTHLSKPKYQGFAHSSKLMGNWHELLCEYGPRELTNPLDKLPAFSGIAKSLNKSFKDEYLAGIWREFLIEGLCWQALRCKPVEQYRAPSWSWASVDGIPATGLLGVTEEVANILEAKVEVDGDNPYGRVKDGWIKLEAPLVKMSLSEAKGPTGHMLFRSEKGGDDCFGMLDTINRSYEASVELIKSMEVYALILAYTYGGPGTPDPERKNPCAHGIYVTPATDRPGCMRRIGAVVQNVKEFGADELASSRATVTIV